MTQIYDFLSRKHQKEEQFILKLFMKANSLDEKLEQLLEYKQLQVADHKLFLSFLSLLEEKNLDPHTMIIDVILLPKHQFEERYKMNWIPVVKLSVTFLTILKQNNPKGFEQLKATLVKMDHSSL